MNRINCPRSLKGKEILILTCHKEATVLMKKKRQLIWLMGALFFFTCAVQTVSAWDMRPPAESIKKAADEFNQAWRREASRQFSELRNTKTNFIASYFLITFLVVMLGVLFYLMGKMNHMERTSRRFRADVLRVYTRMWLISRWGFRY